jgi:hypothetical protein
MKIDYALSFRNAIAQGQPDTPLALTNTGRGVPLQPSPSPKGLLGGRKARAGELSASEVLQRKQALRAAHQGFVQHLTATCGRAKTARVLQETQLDGGKLRAQAGGAALKSALEIERGFKERAQAAVDPATVTLTDHRAKILFSLTGAVPFKAENQAHQRQVEGLARVVAANQLTQALRDAADADHMELDGKRAYENAVMQLGTVFHDMRSRGFGDEAVLAVLADVAGSGARVDDVHARVLAHTAQTRVERDGSPPALAIAFQKAEERKQVQAAGGQARAADAAAGAARARRRQPVQAAMRGEGLWSRIGQSTKDVMHRLALRVGARVEAGRVLADGAQRSDPAQAHADAAEAVAAEYLRLTDGGRSEAEARAALAEMNEAPDTRSWDVDRLADAVLQRPTA